ncbi:zinc finger CCCH domain-containing protein 54-like [Typha latifolia]|uniref:zinc finger CCCH domain-containing protein 54-like n=1 Tax=Typha latifolia TaxID=4733 RepID=UPI003C2B8645
MAIFGGFDSDIVDYHHPTITVPLYLQLAYLPATSSHGTKGATHDRRNLMDESDDFLMYIYKVKRCSKTKSHDWTECPYAHRGEKARRRDPRKFPYNGIACPEFRQSGECGRGQSCEYAHGVFEFWLHPTRYRTRMCEAGLACPRKICFFAHTPEQRRPEVVHNCFRCGGSGTAINSPRRESSIAVASSSSQGRKDGLKMRDGVGGNEDLYAFPHIDWIMDLLNKDS